MRKKDICKILPNLRKDSRMSLTEMSKNTGIPISTVHERVRVIKKNIIKFSCHFDFSILGYPNRVLYLISVDRMHKEDLESDLKAHPSVNNLSRINNGFDFCAECIFSQINHTEEFIDQLRTRFIIRDFKMFFITKSVVIENFLPVL
ncbi:Lrp/AsnC family transcriptional regulator [Candidatus Woesearchaeota archaeon]|nr:Lrp/AsnC family transcriptional regulator [Candidatus Woesearchaeota archaeon]